MKLSSSPRITVHPAICQGQPTVRGLRYPVWQVLDWMASGMSEAAIRTEYPELEAEDLRACLAFAAVRLKPLSHSQNDSQNGSDCSSEWVRSRQRQWLAEQAFLKQLWEPNRLPSDAGGGNPASKAGRKNT